MMHSWNRLSATRVSALLASTVLAGLATPAFAQTSPAVAGQAAVNAAPVAQDAAPLQATPPSGPSAQPDIAEGSSTDIVVTGSRIRTGNTSPTPVTMVSSEQLQATTPSSIPDGLNKLPIFNAGQNTPNNASNSNGKGFGAPGNFLNLRSLGAIRTLILQDGNRVPGTLYDSTVDTNMLPQLLIQRVDVVTGGVSSVYGSDAVAGVVNFITDNKFVGLKGVFQGGISEYGDAKSIRGGLAYGTKVGDRGHFEISGEYYDRNAIKDTGSRPYGDLYPIVTGSGSATNPYKLFYNGRQSNAAPGGLVTTGPFAGLQFLNDGSLAAFNPGTATGTSNAAVGGDGGYVHNEYLVPSIRTAQAFARFDYDLTDTIHAYVQGRYADTRSFSASQVYANVSNATAANPANTSGSYPLWIYSGNPYLTAAQQARLAQTGTSSFALNRFDNDLSRQLGLELREKAAAGTIGANGDLFGSFTWDTHYTYGENTTRYTTQNNVNSANFYAATDAVTDPTTGNVVCRVTLVAPGAYPGCSPLNLFGQGRASQAALDFVFQDTSWTAKNTMHDVGLNTTGTLFHWWAGAAKIAVGGEYRHQTLDVTSSVPSNTFNPQYLRLGSAGLSTVGSYPTSNLAYFKEIQAAGNGDEDIYEGNIEADIPLLKDLPAIQLLTLNGAYRYAKYNASGNGNERTSFEANTWKLGLEWTVSDWARIRATRSKDFRAPTLWDLYQRQTLNAIGQTDPLTGVAGTANALTGGNPDLRPEISKSLTAGIVLTPKFLRNFSLSFDYFNIKVDGAIAGVNGLNPVLLNACVSSGGTSPYCDLVVRPISPISTDPANFPSLVYSLSQNVAAIEAKGFDVEANYTTDLADMGLAGRLNLRTLWTHQPTTTTVTFPGGQITNQSGTQAVPKDKVTFTVDYLLGGFGLNLLERFYSSVHQGINPTLIYDIPNVPAYWQTDATISYDFSGGSKTSYTAFLNVSNVFNAKGGIYQDPAYSSSIGLRYPSVNYADVIGRYFTLGIRFKY